MLGNFYKVIKTSTEIKTIISLLAFCFSLLIFTFLYFIEKVGEENNAIYILASAFAIALLIISLSIYNLIVRNINGSKIGSNNSDLEKLIRNYNGAAEYDIEYFNRIVKEDISAWSNYSSTWSLGIYVSHTNYNQILIDAYTTSTNVQSTTTHEYLSNWNTDLGDLLIECHKKSEGFVERIFIFDSISSVKEEEIKILNKMLSFEFIENRLVFMDKLEELNTNYRTNYKDFVLIQLKDGVAVAETMEFSSNNLVARWYFDKGKSQEICEFQKNYNILRKYSKPLKEFLANTTT